MPARQQPVHHARLGAGRAVLGKRLDLLGCRREAREIERHATQPRPRVRGRREIESFRDKAFVQEGVDRVGRIPARALGRLHVLGREKCPVIRARGRVGHRRIRTARVRGAE